MPNRSDFKELTRFHQPLKADRNSFHYLIDIKKLHSLLSEYKILRYFTNFKPTLIQDYNKVSTKQNWNALYVNMVTKCKRYDDQAMKRIHK